MVKTETPWHAKDEYWETLHPLLFDKEHREKASEEVEDLLSFLQLDSNASILDLCCGIGRHSLELAKRGFHVVGVDKTQKFVQMAKEKAENKDLDVEFIQEDMRDFCKPHAFDAVINMYTSFGYFKEKEDDIQVVKNVYSSLKPGALFLIDVMGKEVLANIFQKRTWVEQEGYLLLQEHNVSNDWSWLDNRWIVIKDGEKKEFNVSHRIYSAVELKQVLSSAGFNKVQVYGSLEGTPYDEEAKRLITVAQKPS